MLLKKTLDKNTIDKYKSNIMKIKCTGVLYIITLKLYSSTSRFNKQPFLALHDNLTRLWKQMERFRQNSQSDFSLTQTLPNAVQSFTDGYEQFK